jgi:predicted transposase YbfD/YdcC
MKNTVKEIERLEELIEKSGEIELLFTDTIKGNLPDLQEKRRLGRGNFQHPLEEIFLVWLCGMLCGHTTYEEIEWYGKTKISFLRRFFPYSNGCPSKSTIARVIALINPQVMKRFLETIATILQSKTAVSQENLPVIALDGKTHRGVQKTAESAEMLHIVSAVDTATGLTLTLDKVPDKTNEITALKEILSTLVIEGRTVTIDAMGTQKEIASIIRERDGHYILALKENQKNLHKATKEFFDTNKEKLKSHQETIKAHGRIEKRTCYVADHFVWHEDKDWTNLESIIMVESERTINGQTSSSTRYFISSHTKPNPKVMLTAIRSHWRIESNHWVLDVTFNEDSRILWERTVAYNEAIARRIIMNMLHYFRETITATRKIKKMSSKVAQRMLFNDDNLLESFLRGTLFNSNPI